MSCLRWFRSAPQQLPTASRGLTAPMSTVSRPARRWSSRSRPEMPSATRCGQMGFSVNRHATAHSCTIRCLWRFTMLLLYLRHADSKPEIGCGCRAGAGSGGAGGARRGRWPADRDLRPAAWGARKAQRCFGRRRLVLAARALGRRRCGRLAAGAVRHSRRLRSQQVTCV